MTKARVSAEGVSFRQPSHSLAGTVCEHPAKSSAKSGIVHIADFVIGRVPFAQDFDGAVEDGRSFGRAARLIGKTVREGQEAENGDNADHRRTGAGEKEGQHHASPSFLRTAGMVAMA
ncbi:MAG: hypothetical protein M9945_12805 [Aquamicrobium sp.]|uniref:hypothetical protein n=1 Tax=Aquamicrobium sp. TaxID=1872579 RepID=UPI00349EF034|nr:hypothetical protein [Aquamicrobium sp.]